MLLSHCSPGDTEEIIQLFKKTFSDSEGQSEGELIGNLAEDLMAGIEGDGILCFKAVEDDRIVACIFFSQLTFERDITAYILSPVAVHTDYQSRGIGQALINYGLNALREMDVGLAITYGDINFYSRVGFEVVDESVIKAPLKLSYPHGWLAQSLTGDEIEPVPGNSYCVEALNKPEYW